jgi:hypothetical protein
MGLQTVPGFIGQAGYNHPPELFRNMFKALTNKASGIMVDYNSFVMTPSGSAMQLTISSGYAALMGVENTTQGSYFVWSDASQTLTWPAASGSNRIDSLILRVIDTQYGTDPDTPQAEWEIVQGVPAGSPVAVADSEFASGGGHYRPGAWYRVANVLVQPGDTNMAATDITDLRSLAGIPAARLNAGALHYQRVIITASGTFVPANYYAKRVVVRVQGGGGAGGGNAATGSTTSACGGGGQAGGYVESVIEAYLLPSSVTVTIGAGGVGVSANPGGAGGQTSFGTFAVASGGAGGSAGAAAATTGLAPGGSGSQTLTGDVGVRGRPGEPGLRLGIGSFQNIGGNGGTSPLGGSGVGGSDALGTAGQGYGSGGGGSSGAASTAARAGANGAPGVVIIDVYN